MKGPTNTLGFVGLGSLILLQGYVPAAEFDLSLVK